MSAELHSLVTASADNSMEEAVAAIDRLECDEGDAADFLLSNSKYHDCFLTVGNPESEKVERIGVASLYLIANSPVFRKMLGSCKQSDLPDAKFIVSDVSPVPFKLMLRYLYGGELPKMTAIETAGLALCADKYKITHLVKKTLKWLKPTSAKDVFPALICVTFASFPELEVQVCKIIQKDTDKVVGSADFLNLDEASVLFILKQDTLNIEEVGLWEHVVCWAEHQVEINPGRTVRDCLAKILGYVRFLTFTRGAILDYVLPKKILTSDEFVDLALAVTQNQELQSPVLCNIQEGRYVYEEEEVKAQSTLDKTENKTTDDISVLQNKSENKPKSIVFNKLCVFRTSDHFKVEKVPGFFVKYSSLTIKPSKSIEIESFTCASLSGQPNTGYMYRCEITIRKMRLKYEQVIHVEGSALSDSDIVLPLKFNSGKPIVMNPGESWDFDLKWDHDHPVHDLVAIDDTWGDVIVNDSPLKGGDMTIKYDYSFHVVQVAYKKHQVDSKK